MKSIELVALQAFVQSRRRCYHETVDLNSRRDWWWKIRLFNFESRCERVRCRRRRQKISTWAHPQHRKRRWFGKKETKKSHNKTTPTRCDATSNEKEKGEKTLVHDKECIGLSMRTFFSLYLRACLCASENTMDAGKPTNVEKAIEKSSASFVLFQVFSTFRFLRSFSVCAFFSTESFSLVFIFEHKRACVSTIFPSTVAIVASLCRHRCHHHRCHRRRRDTQSRQTHARIRQLVVAVAFFCLRFLKWRNILSIFRFECFFDALCGFFFMLALVDKIFLPIFDCVGVLFQNIFAFLFPSMRRLLCRCAEMSDERQRAKKKTAIETKNAR